MTLQQGFIPPFNVLGLNRVFLPHVGPQGDYTSLVNPINLPIIQLRSDQSAFSTQSVKYSRASIVNKC